MLNFTLNLFLTLCIPTALLGKSVPLNISCQFGGKCGNKYVLELTEMVCMNPGHSKHKQLFDQRKFHQATCYKMRKL